MVAAIVPLPLREEFRKDKWGYSITPNELSNAGKSTLCHSWLFCAWRLLAAAYMLAVLIYEIVDTSLNGSIEFTFVYLTWWTFAFQTLYLVLAAVLSLRQRSQPVVAGPPKTGTIYYTKPTKLARCVWFLQDLVYASSAAVSILYWAFENQGSDAVDVQAHGVNIGITVVDCFFSASPPVRLLHAWVPQVYATIYLIWTLIDYYASIGNGISPRKIYKNINWGNPGPTAAFCVVAILVLVPLLQCLLYIWRRIGLSFSLCCCKKSRAKAVEPHQHANGSDTIYQPNYPNSHTITHDWAPAHGGHVAARPQPSAPYKQRHIDDIA